MTERFESPAAASAWCAERRARGADVGFVPTMGALHDGHLALVERAARENDAVCVSVFVNPLQFDDAADLERYPRDFGADVERLASVGCDAAFTGTLEGFFPGGPPAPRDPGPCAAGLEGEHRAGHFAGVATIVARLFELVEPRRAYFGEKDFQQTLVVDAVAAEREGLEVVVCPTVREPDGLALSSRNAFLAPEARRRAVALSRALAATHAAWAQGQRHAPALAAVLRGALEGHDLRVEYATVRDPDAWTAEEPVGELRTARALVAAHVGAVRLIDNLRLDAELPVELVR